MGGIVNIASSGEWERILASSTVVICDFYADWCGPCKVIAPTFESLATKYSKPGRITFCKINVDNHQSITRNLGVTSMPTFLIFKRGSVINTIRGANAQALTAAVEQAIKMADSAPGASFAAPGRTLGGIGSGSGAAPARTSGGNALGGRSLWTSLSPFHLLTSLLTFFGLYFVSLLSFDPYKSAERSDFNVKKPKAPPTPIKLGGNRPAGGPSGTSRPGGVRTLADLGGS